MCRFSLVIAGVVLVSSLVGCSDEPEEGTKVYKGSESEAIAKLREHMSENLKSGKYLDRPIEKSLPTKSSSDKKE